MVRQLCWTVELWPTQTACPTQLDSCVGQFNCGPHKHNVPQNQTLCSTQTACPKQTRPTDLDIMSLTMKQSVPYNYIPHTKLVPHKHVSHTINSMSHKIKQHVSYNQTACPTKPNMSHTIKHIPPTNVLHIAKHMPPTNSMLHTVQFVQHNQTA